MTKFLTFNSSLKVKLKRNLRKKVLQGDPWIYQEAFTAPANQSTACLVKVMDPRNEFLAWAIYSPNSVLGLRILSLDPKSPNEKFIQERIDQAVDLRSHLLSEATNSFRLINGEGDQLPGLICDRYKDVLVLQMDGSDMTDFWDKDFIAQYLLKLEDIRTVIYKPRSGMDQPSQSWGEKLAANEVETLENNAGFRVDIQEGQKTGFFLDQRDNRQFVRSLAAKKSVLNLFSYSGGFSIHAGLGGASQVRSVDIAQEALSLCDKNWAMNHLDPDGHESVCADVLEYLKSDTDKFDLVICDPPSFAKSEKHKPQAFKKYIECFSLAAKRVSKNGYFCMSSCSSHISFNDFEDIVEQSLSGARKKAQVLRISGQGIDHPFPHASQHLRYLKFYAVRMQD